MTQQLMNYHIFKHRRTASYNIYSRFVLLNPLSVSPSSPRSNSSIRFSFMYLLSNSSILLPVSSFLLSSLSVSFQPHLFWGTLTHLGRSLPFSLQLVIYFPIARALFFTLSPVVSSSRLLFPPVTRAAFSE